MRKYISIFIGAFIIPYVLLGTFVFLIDPYYVFHKPLFKMEPIRTDDPHNVARGLIRNLDYDILICGTSMCENMHTDYADAVFNCRSAKVIQHGSYSNDLSASLKQAARADKAQVIIMGLDTTMWKKPSEGYRMEGIPGYAVESPNLVNSLPYIFNINSLKSCFNLIKINHDGNVTAMNSWWGIADDAYGIDSVAASWIEENNGGYSLSEINETLAWENYGNLVEGIEACNDKGIIIKFFIPPYSVADFSFYDYDYELKLDKEIWRNLLRYDNVEIYAIQFDTELIQHFEWYRNTGHYNGTVCDAIIDDIANGEFLLTIDNIDEQVDQFEQFLDAYNWEELEATFVERGMGLNEKEGY